MEDNKALTVHRRRWVMGWCDQKIRTRRKECPVCAVGTCGRGTQSKGDGLGAARETSTEDRMPERSLKE